VENSMKRLAAALLTTLVLSPALAAQRAPTKSLDIYVIDTEGGKATLFVSPTGQTLLIDSGNPGNRDTDRVIEAIAAAGVTQIDYLLSTHYHGDHIGGMQELAQRIAIGTYVDHGPTVEEREHVAGFQQAYAGLKAKAKSMVVKPGDRVPLTGVDWRIVTAGGGVLKTPLPGGGKPNPACASFTPKNITNDLENAQSVGSVITFGQFRAIDLGDLLWNKEFELMCPTNPIGAIDLYLVTHHGTDSSGSAAAVHGLRPRVAVMQNGTRKGAGTEVMPILRTSPGLEDIWQLHWAHNAGIEQNSAGVFIANVEDAATVAGVLTAPPRGRGPGLPGGPPPPPAGAIATQGGIAPPPVAAVPAQTPAAPQAGGGPPAAGRGGAAAHSPAYWIKISAQADGTFTVTNSRNGFSKTYMKR
jgi:beta-lactamase superfamily II metal-dependent hydrolase